MTPARGETERLLAIAGLATLVVGCFLVVRPFASAFLWAVVMVYSTTPMHLWLRRKLVHRPTLAATLMTGAITMVLVLPLALVAVSLAENVNGLVAAVRSVLDHGLGPAPQWLTDIPLIGGLLEDAWPDVGAGEAQLASTIKPYLGTAADWVLGTGAAIGGGLLELILSVVFAFFLYRASDIAAERLRIATNRLGGAPADRLLDIAGGTIRGVVYGVIGSNLIQGILSGLGFWAAGVPGAFLLGFLCFFLTMIPIVPALVWVPAGLYVWHEGSLGIAIALWVWSFTIFSPLETVLRPYLISLGSSLPLVLVLVGMLGGIIAFGFLGIVLGPTLLAIAYALVVNWTEPTNA